METETSLLLADCSEDVTVRDIVQLFLNVNLPVTAVRIAKDNAKDRPLGYAHVLFESAGAARTAIASLGGEGTLVMLGDNGTARVSMGRTYVQKSLDEMNLFIKGFDKGSSPLDVRGFLTELWRRRSGSHDELQIDEVRIPEDLSLGETLGYALLSLPMRHQVQTLLQAAKENVGDDRVKMGGRDIVFKRISTSPHGDDRSESLTISVAGLPDYVTEIELRERLRPYGIVTALNLMPMKHIAFVKYRHNLQALAAQTDLEGEEMRDSILKVKWARHEVLASGEETEGLRSGALRRDESDRWFVNSLLPERASDRREEKADPLRLDFRSLIETLPVASLPPDVPLSAPPAPL